MINKKILVVAAHPDDEILGCGGTLIKYQKKGFKIKIIFLSDGESSRAISKKILNKLIIKRQTQAIKVSKNCKFLKPEFINLPDNKLDSIPIINIIKKIEDEIINFKPGIVFTHSQTDLNIDHQIACKAVTTATRPLSRTFVKSIFCFEVPSSTECNFSEYSNNFKPNYFENITNSINFKLKTLKIYKSEIKQWPHARSLPGIKILSQFRGIQIGVKYAEAFNILRLLSEK